jgi:cytochrome c peroxidase
MNTNCNIHCRYRAGRCRDCIGVRPSGTQSQRTTGQRPFLRCQPLHALAQACAACHGPEVGFTGPDAAINAAGAVYEGAVPGRFGNRKPPASAYASDSPVFHLDARTGTFVGGMFWDGRATGWTLGDPLAEQAQGPFLNPLEQNNASPATVVAEAIVAFLQTLTDGYKSHKD